MLSYYQESGYLQLLSDILNGGDSRSDRTGVGTRSLFGASLTFYLEDGFPAITTKKLAWKTTVSELLWFVEGSGDERRLAELLHGTRDPSKSTIWTANAEAPYWIYKAKYPGDLGRVYGVQWRHWKKPDGTEVDQLANLINTIKTNPTDRRMVLSAFNVGEIDNMALPPCHMFSQYYICGGKLSSQVYIRSSDAFLGLPINIASYALLQHMIAAVTGLKVGVLNILLGDVHLYNNQLGVAIEQITRTPLSLPLLDINYQGQSIDDFVIEDFSLVNYEHHPALTVPMAV